MKKDKNQWLGPIEAYSKRNLLQRIMGIKNPIPYKTLVIFPCAPRSEELEESVVAVADFSRWKKDRIIYLQRYFPELAQFDFAVNQNGVVFLDRDNTWDFVEGGDTSGFQLRELQS